MLSLLLNKIFVLNKTLCLWGVLETPGCVWKVCHLEVSRTGVLLGERNVCGCLMCAQEYRPPVGSADVAQTYWNKSILMMRSSMKNFSF